MGSVRKISISVSDDLAGMMTDAVNTGSYNSTSEVVREALRDWEVKQARIHALKTKIQAGFDDLDSGNITEYENADALYNDIMKN